MKSKTTALILAVLVGGLGVDRFYIGYTGMGLLKLFTGGCFGVLWLIDIINIATGKLRPADGSDYDEDLNGSQATNNKSNQFDDLEKLAKLYEQGVLSDEEYNKMKADILDKK